jgi:predicted nucleic acid-binding protein
MKVYLDTCALFKLYHNETGTEEIENIFIQNKISGIFLSEISKIEFASTVWKKVRMKDITEVQANTLIELFENDLSKFTFIQVDNIIIELSKYFISKHGREGLRTLDSIQLSTSVMLKERIDLFKTTDNLLNKFLSAEGLPISLVRP